jgi:hypothetical protein
MSGTPKHALEVCIGKCPRCGECHTFTVEVDSPPDRPVYLPCPNVTRFYRLRDVMFDSRPTVERFELMRERVTEHLRLTHGELGLDEKLRRWDEVKRAKTWLVDEFNEQMEDVLEAYVQGLFFPAMTGACCLGERVMNRLVFKTAEHFRSSPHYKWVWKKRGQKAQDWPRLIEVLNDWRLFDGNQADMAKKLHGYRNDSVHYIPDYDFRTSSLEAVRLVVELIDTLFSAQRRKDVLRVHEIPGEIWLRADAQGEPFVQEFVIPCCTPLAATHQLLGPDSYAEDGAIPGQMTEETFIAQRKDYQQNPEKYRDGRTPKEITQLIAGVRRTFVVP